MRERGSCQQRGEPLPYPCCIRQPQLPETLAVTASNMAQAESYHQPQDMNTALLKGHEFSVLVWYSQPSPFPSAALTLGTAPPVPPAFPSLPTHLTPPPPHPLFYFIVLHPPAFSHFPQCRFQNRLGWCMAGPNPCNQLILSRLPRSECLSAPLLH